MGLNRGRCGALSWLALQRQGIEVVLRQFGKLQEDGVQRATFFFFFFVHGRLESEAAFDGIADHLCEALVDDG